MIVVFNQLPAQTAPTASPFNPFVQKAAAAATEVTNTIYWLVLN